MSTICVTELVHFKVLRSRKIIKPWTRFLYIFHSEFFDLSAYSYIFKKMLYFLENIDTSKTFKQEFLLNHTNDAFFMSELPEYI